ncbi:MAG: helix-turn-helix domain containing protein [Candidatus Marinimicrobia bacterium]|nr:helix-turn-helix domain containing protein [Candidatus Neomarinimicrobiota bacterium]
MISEHNKEISVKRVIAGEHITKVCHDIGVSRGSMYTWIKRYEKEGVVGLFPMSRRPKSNPKSLGKDSISLIYNTALDNPADDIRSLKKILDNTGHRFSISTIHKYLRKSEISTREERKILLLLWLELDGEENLGAQRVRGLETLSRHFAERNNIAARSGEKYYVSIEYLQTGSHPHTEIRVWHFIDLYSFHVTSIIEDHNEWDDESRDHYKKFVSSSGINDDHVGHYCFPIFVWWKAYVEKQNSSPIRLILNSTDFFTVSQKKLSMQLASTNIKLKFVKTGPTLPWAFLSDFRRSFREIYDNCTLHLSMDEPTHKRHDFFSKYIGRSLLAYNQRELSALFPRSRATPNIRSHFSDVFKESPSLELSQFLHSWGNDSELFNPSKSQESSTEWLDDDSGWLASNSGTEYSDPHRYGRQEMGDRPNVYLDEDSEDVNLSGREKLRERQEKVEHLKNNAFSRAQQEIDIKKHTDMNDPNSDLRKMNERVPFKLVYEKIMDEKPKGRYWICPRCGEKAMSYYPKPNGKHVNNHGYCHYNQGGCNGSTNSVNLIQLKRKFQFPQALKWLLANFNPEDYGVTPDYYLFDDDRKYYRHRA